MAGQSRFFIGFSASVAGFCRHFCCLKPTGFWLNLTSRIWFKWAIHGYQGFDSCPVSIRRVQEMNVVAYNRAIGACTKSHSLALGQTWQAGKSHGKSAIEFDDFPTKTSIWFGDYQRGRFFYCSSEEDSDKVTCTTIFRDWTWILGIFLGDCNVLWDWFLPRIDGSAHHDDPGDLQCYGNDI